MDENRRFFNPHQPQTLQISVMLLYINAFFLVLGGAIFVAFPLWLAVTAGLAAGGFGIANEQKWGYQVAVGAAAINLFLRLAGAGLDAALSNAFFLIGIMFDIALVALLLHPQSREYQKIWFR
ncbi:MAG TPA: hypothetical protein VM618_08245 [Acidimicrobiia bacterium]|nr:hypothetical protein [Acidimicrobiia bacterium]